MQVLKWATVVQLLMGETPERSIFRSGPMQAYFKLAQSVRVGDVAAFEQVKEQHRDNFRADSTFMLVNRLHQTVIKTGLRNINRSYSCISLAEVAKKLSLDENLVSVAFIVAKAIRDGVIDGVIDHAGQFLQSTEQVDVYQTTAPQKTFDVKVRTCLEIHNDAVKVSWLWRVGVFGTCGAV
jgi:26S proteasome regulatory subunit N3